jgi:nucleotide-binding universal stress UspA family protein
LIILEKDPFLEKILVLADGSPLSNLAMDTSVRMVKKTGSKVTVLHVIPDRVLYSGFYPENIPFDVITKILDGLEERGKKIISEAQELFKKEGIEVEAQIIRGPDPAEVALEYSRQGFDIVIVGARGEDEKDPRMLGSITRKVVMNATVPTLIIKKECPLERILVCVDGSEHSIVALDYITKLAQEMGSKITVINVEERKLYDMSPKTAVEGGQLVISHALSAIGKPDLPVEKRVEFGVTSDVLVEVAEKEGIDLIVMGSRGLGTVRRFLLGSVSDDVSQKARTSVLIVPWRK